MVADVFGADGYAADFLRRRGQGQGAMPPSPCLANA